ncbi:putative multicopper oxidase [Actinoplanes missouriensis 431]|uniref:Putative multicopper oxidase n=1 Tax=Actinoplanes missouriensis (strain ATCC 14538 / DSM 43046 / CBS 188.64 / JCM 3121 / NBRC 102363 / NCIMB 12654 / NRRL B-3342 / UNCC 431) TaxID=512565 RepID=I0HJG5_ACTM4|nr:multicopper oxidase family protein [Actinoplanes missouriensis]BAL93152.1 putative multicopper oxidase [Actinoplanes missouriensis 431]
MAEPLFITDLLLAAFAAVSAIPLGLRAARGRPTRWPLIITVLLVTARMAVTALLAAENWQLVTDRVVIGLPAAVLPLVAALAVTSRAVAHRIAAQIAAVGVFVSAYLAWVPQDPAARPLAVAIVLVILAATGVVASALLSRRGDDASPAARLPWLTGLTTLALVAAIAALYVQNQAPASAAGHDHHGIDIATLTGPRQGSPDVTFTLVAAHGKIKLTSGTEIDGLTLNGSSPGPVLRARQGQLVEVTLINTDVTEGVTLHWHGVDVPNAEDGVPGLTQDAVRPGGRHVYRFVPDRSGTFWYHTHRDSTENVARGLFGALLIDPPSGPATGTTHDTTLFTHQWPGGEDQVSALGTADTASTEHVAPRTPVRLRLINSSQDPQRIQITGAEHRVSAIDGNAVHEPGPLPSGGMLLLAAGGRYDVSFPMPATPVIVSLHTDGSATVPTRTLTPGAGGAAITPPTGDGPLFDPTHYGTPDATPGPAAPTRTQKFVLDNGFGFANGGFTWANTVNGASAPAIPTVMVDLGDTVRVRITNRGIIDHPMHLHGHRVRVLSRNGATADGSPWWTDTLNVAPGETYEITFTADNPGVWMDHCHNFEHAAGGMLWHLAYTGVAAPAHPAHDAE